MPKNEKIFKKYDFVFILIKQRNEIKKWFFNGLSSSFLAWLSAHACLCTSFCVHAFVFVSAVVTNNKLEKNIKCSDLCFYVKEKKLFKNFFI